MVVLLRSKKRAAAGLPYKSTSLTCKSINPTPGLNVKPVEHRIFANSISDGDSSLSIGYYSPQWPPEGSANGIVTAIATLTPALRAQGHKVTILTPHNPVPKKEIVCAAPVYVLTDSQRDWNLVGGAVRKLGHRLFPNFTFNYVMGNLIKAALRRAQTEQGIQLFEMEETFGLAQRVCSEASIPICVRLHGPRFLNHAMIKEAAQTATLRRCIRLEGEAIQAAHAITAPSRDVLDRVRQFYGITLPDAKVIPGTTPAVPVESRWRLETAEPKTVLFIGDGTYRKGWDLIIQACVRVFREVPESQLWLVGRPGLFVGEDGRRWTHEDYINDRLPGALQRNRVKSLGYQPPAELEALRRKAFLTVICSRYETFSSATLEAMTHGCPVVAARIGGMTEIVQEGIDGLMHRAGDSEDLATRIIELLEDPDRAGRFGREAGESCERRFHPQVISARMTEFYRDVIQKWKSP